MFLAMRSLTDPPGFCISSLSRTRTLFAFASGVRTLLTRTSGVLPMVSMMFISVMVRRSIVDD